MCRRTETIAALSQKARCESQQPCHTCHKHCQTQMHMPFHKCTSSTSLNCIFLHFEQTQKNIVKTLRPHSDFRLRIRHYAKTNNHAETSIASQGPKSDCMTPPPDTWSVHTCVLAQDPRHHRSKKRIVPVETSPKMTNVIHFCEITRKHGMVGCQRHKKQLQ